MIKNFLDLLQHFGADNPEGLNRMVYKMTDCGASITVTLKDGAVFKNGDDWLCLSAEAEVESFTIQTIVEGSDAEVNSHAFILPVSKKEVDGFIEYMEAQADILWREANEPEDDDCQE